jgi:hypothetical protein
MLSHSPNLPDSGWLPVCPEFPVCRNPYLVERPDRGNPAVDFARFRGEVFQTSFGTMLSAGICSRSTLCTEALPELFFGRDQSAWSPMRYIPTPFHTKFAQILRYVGGRTALTLRGRFSTALEEANLQEYTRHCNPHTFASRLVMAGVDLRTVAELPGHRTLQVVVRYAHLAPGAPCIGPRPVGSCRKSG